MWAECLPSHSIRHFTGTLCRYDTYHFLLSQEIAIHPSLTELARETLGRGQAGQGVEQGRGRMTARERQHNATSGADPPGLALLTYREVLIRLVYNGS